MKAWDLSYFVIVSLKRTSSDLTYRAVQFSGVAFVTRAG